MPLSSTAFRTVGMVLGLIVGTNLQAQSTTPKGTLPKMKLQEVAVQRVNITSTESFDIVLARVNAALGHPDMVEFRKQFSAAKNVPEMQAVVGPATEPNGLMEFTRFDLGEVLRKDNQSDWPRMVRIVAGNPLVMKEMAKLVADTGSYAPITILIEERKGDVRICYDRMASYLAPYGSEQALQLARALDTKVERIIEAAAR